MILTPRTYRTYTAQFKAELVAACWQSRSFYCGIGRQHGINPNVLHRWFKEHQAAAGVTSRRLTALPLPHKTTSSFAAFIPIQLPVTMPQLEDQEIKLELLKGALSMAVTWPVSAAAEHASWTGVILK